MTPEQKLSVFGMGKLGCTMLACFANKGWQVTGVDISPDIIEKINNGISPIYEPKVDALLKKNKANIYATLDPLEAVLQTEVSFIIVPTPSLPDGRFELSFVENVLIEVGSALSKKEKYHLIVITSTVLPGDMERLKQILEKVSGKKCGADFGMCYNPDFIALGNIVQDFTNPDMVLIGEYDSKSGDQLYAIHHHLVENSPIYNRMNFYNAELCKIAINSYCTLKITFANVIAEICEQMPGGDADQVTAALGSDSRIGKKYIKGGLSYGGPCFPRDNRAFAWSAAQFGVHHVLSNQTDLINNYQRDKRIPEKIEAVLKKHGTKEIAILGITYKGDTTLVEESAGLYIAKALLEKDYEVTIYDPAGMDAAKIELNEYKNLHFTNSVAACLKNQKICLLAAPWKEFAALKEEDFLNSMQPDPVLIDGWSFYQFNNSDISYIRIGKN